MFNNKKIGVGIITYNRAQNCRELINSIRSIDYIDSTILVKNKNIDYGYDIESEHWLKYINIPDDLGVGYCKNVALEYLIDSGCEYLFLVEDDTIIKNSDVFKYYIQTAEHFNMEHLVFGYGSSGNKPNQFDESIVTPYCILKSGDYCIDFYLQLQGAFTFYTKNLIRHIGLFDDKHYINALEHVEHTYRASKYGSYSPFWAFADVHDSINYLGWLHEDERYETTIEQNNDVYNNRLHNAYTHFRDVYNLNINQIPRPSKTDIQRYIVERIKK